MDATEFPYLMNALVKKIAGTSYTLLPSAARTSDVNSAAFKVGGHRRMVVELNLTAVGSGNSVDDKLDVFIDFLAPDGATWLNGGHFTQISGTTTTAVRFMVFEAQTPGTADFDVATDCASGVVRPYLFGPAVRARTTITNGGGDHSFTFSVTAYGE